MARRTDYWSEDQARAHLEAFSRSGLSLTAYCERIGVTTQRMLYWRDRLQPAPQFLEVVVPVARDPDPLIELVFPTGHVLRVPAAIGLESVLRAAGLLSC